MQEDTKSLLPSDRINQQEDWNSEDSVDEELSCKQRTMNCLIALKPAPCPWTLGGYLRLLFVILLLGILVTAAIFHSVLQEFLGETGPLRGFIESLGWIGPVVYGLVYALCTVFMVPGTILSLASGIIFPQLWVAFLTISLGSTLGASFAFLVGRFVLRSWVVEKTKDYTIFQAIDSAIAKKGVLMVFLVRLSPVIPFNILNYALALTGISFPGYVYGSWVGMAPGTFMYIFIPWAGVHALSSQGGANIVKDILVYGVGTAVTIAIVVFVTILAKRAIDKEVALQKEHKRAERRAKKNIENVVHPELA